MPVGTQATVKARGPARARATSARRSSSATPTTCASGPGAELIAELGGLHRFMGWERPILTDSGGFQVVSASRDTRKIDDDGRDVPLASTTARAARFTPERAMEIQAHARLRHRDGLRRVPAGGRAARRRSRRAVERTVALGRALRRPRPRPDGQLRFGIVQGGIDLEPARALGRPASTALAFDGYAIGGLSVGEERELMFDVTARHAPRCCRPSARAT